jgi:hypothetical protein
MRTAAIIEGADLVNIVVFADDAGPDVFSTTCVEITGMDPQPALGLGWTYVDGEFVAPTEFELPEAE